MADVDAPTGRPGDREVARHDDLFGLGGTPREAERVRVHPFVHVAARDERGILAVIGDHDLVRERLRVEEGVAEHAGGRHAVAVVAEHANPGLDHLSQLGHRLSREPLRDRSDREDVGEPGLGSLVPDLGHDAGVIRDGIGVGHR